MAKVIVGMSGGVDSAVTAYLLKLAGFEVVGVTLRTWMSADGKESRCCEIDDARRAAYKIGIPYYALNCIMEFKNTVTDPFIEDYIKGITPNPCVICNRTVKWDKMIYTAGVMNAQYIATGHYANIVKLDNGRYTVGRAAYAGKDQTYMLYRLTQEQLSKTLMPLGNLSKEEVREIARKAQIPVAEKADSQEICFVTDGNYAEYVETFAECDIPPEGNFVTEDGTVVGRHKGIIHYTVGQRRGLNIAMGYPVYVKEIRARSNEVVIGPEESLLSREILVKDPNFLSIAGLSEGEKLCCKIRIRYHHAGQSGTIEKQGERIKVVFDEPVRAAAPGQSAVFYDENEYVIGGGIIDK